MHLVVDLRGCDPERISSVGFVEAVLEKVVDIVGLTPIHSHFHQFKPHGVTGFVLLKESHLSVHTWPEMRYAAVDVFSCRRIENPDSVVSLLRSSFGGKAEVKILDRLRA